jgi:hypothetical protein
MIRSFALPALSAAVLALAPLVGGCVDEDRVVYVRSVPPPEAAEVVAVSPSPNTFYARGHWEWDGSHYVWRPSRYIHRPHARAVWVEGHWQSSPRGWFWEPGHWAEVGKVKGPRVYSVPATPAAPPTVVEEQAPPAQVEEEFATPPGGAATAPKAAVPAAPTYLPPPPPANPPPPPGAQAVPVPQRYVAPTPGAEY